MANIKSIGGNPIVLDASGIAAGAVTPDKLADMGGITAGAALGITGNGPTESAEWLQRVSTSDGPTTIRSIHGNTIVQDGELVSVNMTGIESTGFNQWDPANVRTNIFVNGATGKIAGGTDTQTAVVEVYPNTDYCLTYTGGNRCIIAGVDSMAPAAGDDARVIFNTSSNVSPKVFNTGSNRYIAAFVATSAAPASDICINLSDPTRNGTYEPYWHQERTIPAGTLRSAGTVYDELTGTERITRVGERAYQSGDESDPTVITDGTVTHYPLATPTTTPIDPPLNLTYRTEQGGTERVVVPTGENSAPPTLVTAQGYTAESLLDAALSAIAPIENGLASTNYGVGSYLVHGGQLCKVTTAIATGEAITIGTNVTATTVMAEILSLLQ